MWTPQKPLSVKAYWRRWIRELWHLRISLQGLGETNPEPRSIWAWFSTLTRDPHSEARDPSLSITYCLRHQPLLLILFYKLISQKTSGLCGVRLREDKAYQSWRGNQETIKDIGLNPHEECTYLKNLFIKEVRRTSERLGILASVTRWLVLSQG